MRKSVWPPTIKRHVTGRAFCRWKGRTYYLGKFGTDGVKERFDRLCAELASGVEPMAGKGSVTVEEVVARFLAHSSTVRPSREQKQFSYSLKPLLAIYASLPAAEFGPKCLRLVRSSMEQKGWARTLINHRIVRIRTCWRWAESDELVPKGSWESLRTLRGIGNREPGAKNTKPREPVHIDRMRPVLRCIRPAIRDMILLQYWSGMRPTETREMRVEFIDRSEAIWVYRPDKHKSDWREGDTGRVVILGLKCQAVLRKRLVGRTDGPLFTTRTGRNIKDGTYARAVRLACAKAGVKGFTPYCLRHGAKQRITRRHGLDAARAALGQKSLGVTNLYASEQDEQLARRAAS